MIPDVDVFSEQKVTFYDYPISPVVIRGIFSSWFPPFIFAHVCLLKHNKTDKKPTETVH